MFYKVKTEELDSFAHCNCVSNRRRLQQIFKNFYFRIYLQTRQSDGGLLFVAALLMSIYRAKWGPMRLRQSIGLLNCARSKATTTHLMGDMRQTETDRNGQVQFIVSWVFQAFAKSIPIQVCSQFLRSNLDFHKAYHGHNFF